MVQIREHVMHPQPESTQKGKFHIHANWSGDARFTEGDTTGTLIFYGDGVVVLIDDRRGHFHIDITEELEALIGSVQRGDYDIK